MYSALVNPSNASNVFTTIMETEGKTRKEKQSNSKTRVLHKEFCAGRTFRDAGKKRCLQMDVKL